MTNNQEIIDILSNKDIIALNKWINNGGDAKVILQDHLKKISLIQFVIKEIDNDDDEDVYLEMLKVLIGNGADVNYFNNVWDSPVSDLISLNKPKLLRFILENGANVHIIDEEQETPLITLALAQNIELMKLVLPYTNQEFINKSGSFQVKTALGLAFLLGNLEMIELLLKYKADPFANDGEGYLTIESIPKDIDEDLKNKIFNLIEQYKAK